MVEDDVVEENKVIDTWKAADKNRDSYNIFINPTLDCNLHCWYCYEKHIKHSLLDEKVMAFIKCSCRQESDGRS